MDYQNFKQAKLSWQEEYDFSVSNLVTEARIHAGLTQERLAKKAKTTQSSIARAERGATLPGHELLKRIATAVGTTLVAPQFGFMVEEQVPKESFGVFSETTTASSICPTTTELQHRFYADARVTNTEMESVN